jgi:DNA-binding NarL/FixJ family response regulator
MSLQVAPPPIRTILADDYVPLRHSLRSLLERSGGFDVIAEAGRGDEALRLVEEMVPDLLLLDVEMPGMDGLEVARRLRISGLPVKVLVLSAYNDRNYVFSVLEQGAAGYLIKDESPQKIVEAAMRVAGGECGWFSEEIKSYMPIRKSPPLE